MPYADRGDKICKPGEYSNIKKGDIILIYPALLKIKGYLIEFPPLSIISDECENIIESPNWIEGYVVKGDEKIVFYEGEEEVYGSIEVKENILTAYTLKSLLPDGIRLKVLRAKVVGNPILSIKDLTLVSLQRGRVVSVYTKDLTHYFKPFAYSIFYYITPSSSEEAG